MNKNKIPKFLDKNYSDIDKSLIGVDQITYKEISGLSPSKIHKEKELKNKLN